MTTLIAEDLLLLLLNDETGKLTSTTNLDALLGGALLSELAVAGAVLVGEKEGLLRRRKVRANEPTPPFTDPVLRRALATVMERERSAEDLVARLGKNLRTELLDRMVERGLVSREETTVLGVFPRRRWPAADTQLEHALRSRLQAVLVGGEDPDQRTAAVIALLYAIDRAHKEVERGDLSARDVRKRAKAVAEGDWGAAAVRDVIQASQAAVMAAVMVASTAGYAGS